MFFLLENYPLLFTEKAPPAPAQPVQPEIYAAPAMAADMEEAQFGAPKPQSQAPAEPPQDPKIMAEKARAVGPLSVFVTFFGGVGLVGLDCWFDEYE